MRAAVLRVFGLAVVVSIASAAFAEPVDVTAKNRSSWTLAHVSFSSAGQDEWSADVLGGAIVGLGDGFSFQVPACGSYDLKIVDTSNRSCVISDVDLCSDVNQWVLTNDALRECEDQR